jgi:arsenate reductase
MWDKPRVLFLCTGHPERSEMAEGFLRALAKDAIQPVSAAVEPAPLDPLAVDAMNEVGIDISHQMAKDLRTALQERFAYVVGLGDKSKERCPVFPFAFRVFQWSLEDPLVVQGPTEQRLAAFRRVRNQIAHQVRELVDLACQDKPKASLARSADSIAARMQFISRLA